MSLTMKGRILTAYDLFLAAGAIWIGIQMVQSTKGIFSEEFPDSWASALPFESWVMPGVLAIVLFGCGNIIAALCSLKKDSNSSWYGSAIMGAIFLIGLIYQHAAVGEMYIVSGPFFTLALLQLILSGYVYVSYKKERNPHMTK